MVRKSLDRQELLEARAKEAIAAADASLPWENVLLYEMLIEQTGGMCPLCDDVLLVLGGRGSGKFMCSKKHLYSPKAQSIYRRSSLPVREQLKAQAALEATDYGVTPYRLGRVLGVSESRATNLKKALQEARA